jgi:hypothetical protein
LFTFSSLHSEPKMEPATYFFTANYNQKPSGRLDHTSRSLARFEHLRLS